MNEDQKEVLGQLIDRLDNLSHGLRLNMPDHIHVDAFRASLPEIVEELKQSFTEITGENPWA